MFYVLCKGDLVNLKYSHVLALIFSTCTLPNKMEIKVLESMVCCFWVPVIGYFTCTRVIALDQQWQMKYRGKLPFEPKLFIVITSFYCLISTCTNLIVRMYLKYCIMALGCVNSYFERQIRKWRKIRAIPIRNLKQTYWSFNKRM